MNQVLKDFLDILAEATFKARSKETNRVVVFRTRDTMQAAIDAGTHDPVKKGTAPKKPAVKKVAAKKAPAKKKAVAAQGEQPKGAAPKGKKKESKPAITRGMVDPAKPASKIVDALFESNAALATARDHGDAGMGGKSASYGEVGLTQLTNRFTRRSRGKSGLDAYIRENESEIAKRAERYTNPKQGKDEDDRKFRERQKAIAKTRIGLARQLGLMGDEDTELSDEAMRTVTRYMAARDIYVEEEIARLKADKTSIYYTENWGDDPPESETTAREWAKAQFDGAVATTDLVETQGSPPIDTTQPYVIIQSEGKPDSQDAMVKVHLQRERDKARAEGRKDDEAYYDAQLDAWDKLGFHDTMAVGVDEKGRLAVFHISNKKAGDLSDIWNNTTASKAMQLFRESYMHAAAGASPEQIAKVEDKMEKGARAMAAQSRGTAEQFVDIEIDDALVDVHHALATVQFGRSSNPKDYTRKACDGRDFQAWLKTLPEKERARIEKAINQDAGKGKKPSRAGVKARLLALQEFARAQAEQGKPVPKALGHLMTKAGEKDVQRKMKERNGASWGEDSATMQTCVGSKKEEGDVLGKVHEGITSAVVRADRAEGTPKGENGPHARAYIGTVLHAMHFDVMVTNYDSSFGAVTGIRGSTPQDFRECLAELSGFEGPTDTPEQRKALNEHLLNVCRLNPTTRAIEIQVGKERRVLAEDSWRSAGQDGKVEKKLGKSIRECVMKKADGRRKERGGASTISRFG